MVFFIASAYFQIKSNEDMTKPDSDDFKRLEKLEIDGYELAKQIRKEILQEVCICLSLSLHPINFVAGSYKGSVLHDENPAGCSHADIC